MDEFYSRLKSIDRNALKDYLRALEAPCYESQLFQIAFPGQEISDTAPLTLYQNHFLLFHLLYQLQGEFYQEKKYLFVHFMRTMLLPYPEAANCRFFDEQLVLFCHSACHAGEQYCSFHDGLVGDSALDELSVKYFYADPGNFYKLDEDTVTAFLNGTWEILAHYDRYTESFKVLGLAENADLPQIKRTFKRLARQYHPDLGGQSHERFLEINNAYQFLIQVIPGVQMTEKS
ncbi:MAG: DnaJ domain-containing protein [bacterium]|nr:DnaJ domain-containing protein [bacterium]